MSEHINEASDTPVTGPAHFRAYSRLRIVEALDAAGKLEDFELVLNGASARVRMRWQAAVELVGDDADFLSMVEIMQKRWKMNDWQAKELLRSCGI